MKKGDIVIGLYKTGLENNKKYVVNDVLYCEYCGFQYVNLDNTRTTIEEFGECYQCDMSIRTRNLRWMRGTKVQLLSENRKNKIKSLCSDQEIK